MDKVSTQSYSASPATASGFIRGVLLKAALFLILINLLFVAVYPLSTLGRLSLYNWLFPGRLRLPFGEAPERAYNLSLYQLDAMFASHVLNGTPKPASEYRVFLLGDSNTWGFLLRNEQTLAGRLNALKLSTPDGQEIRFYNLGYPTISLTKDLLLLDYALRYDPDMVIWLVTLEAFPQEKQLSSPLVQNNPAPVRQLIQTYQLPANPNDPAFAEETLWERTILSQRRTLADMLRLQLYGVMWAATGIDQDYPATYTPVQSDLAPDLEYGEFSPPELPVENLAFDVLLAGNKMLGERPLLIVNEPIYISRGENSHLRYNFYYPRWAYDEYRRLLAQESQNNGWITLDLWDMIEPGFFTNTAIHLDPEGTEMLAERIAEFLYSMLSKDTATK
jgi:hypothetical protein